MNELFAIPKESRSGATKQTILDAEISPFHDTATRFDIFFHHHLHSRPMRMPNFSMCQCNFLLLCDALHMGSPQWMFPNGPRYCEIWPDIEWNSCVTIIAVWTRWTSHRSWPSEREAGSRVCVIELSVNKIEQGWLLSAPGDGRQPSSNAQSRMKNALWLIFCLFNSNKFKDYNYNVRAGNAPVCVCVCTQCHAHIYFIARAWKTGWCIGTHIHSSLQRSNNFL